MVEFRTDSVMFVSGKRRFGKSVFVTKKIWDHVSNVIFHDPKWEHAILAQDPDVNLVHHIKDVEQLHNNSVHKILYQPYNSSITDFDSLCKLLFQWGNILLIVDEVKRYTSPQFIPHWLGEIIRMGTTRGIGVVCLTQRPREVHNTLISEADIVISFYLRLDTDCQKIAQVIGPDASKLSKLPRYYYMLYDDIEGIVHLCTPINISHS